MARHQVILPTPVSIIGLVTRSFFHEICLKIPFLNQSLQSDVEWWHMLDAHAEMSHIYQVADMLSLAASGKQPPSEVAPQPVASSK